jgi:acid phosphatase class B
MSISGKFKQIKTFADIAVSPKTLVVFDIDDTVIGYEEFSHTYFTDRLQYYKEKYDCSKMVLDFALDDWITKVKSGTPFHMDKNGYTQLINTIRETDSHYMFMTARNPLFRDTTEDHLEKIGIINRQVHYLAGANKGEFLKNIIKKYPQYDKLIFIDDMEKNLNDLHLAFGNKIDLYHFVKKYCI